MSGSIAIIGLWGTDKTVALSGYTPHQHVPSPIEPHFTAPERVSSLTFGPVALAAAVARAATTRDDAPVAVLDALQRSTLPMLETMIEGGTTFGLSTHFQYLADTERTFLAARIGAGITDLYMNALGYTWRANAACLSSTLDPHADFIYEGGNASGYGVILAEAHGSFAANASAQSVHLQSKNKYLRQVKPYLAGTSPYGKVIHGYSIAFGSRPSVLGAFLSLSETKITRPRGTKGRRRRPKPLKSVVKVQHRHLSRWRPIARISSSWGARTSSTGSIGFAPLIARRPNRHPLSFSGFSMLDANTWCTHLRSGGVILHRNGWRISSTTSTFGATHRAGRQEDVSIADGTLAGSLWRKRQGRSF